MHTPFQIVETPRGVELKGELDALGAPQLSRFAPGAQGPDGAEVDLSGLTFVDSAGLHALIDLKQREPGIRLVNPSKQLERLLDITATRELLLGPAER
jgi:anti-anti-sigma factor